MSAPQQAPIEPVSELSGHASVQSCVIRWIIADRAIDLRRAHAEHKSRGGAVARRAVARARIEPRLRTRVAVPIDHCEVLEQRLRHELRVRPRGVPAIGHPVVLAASAGDEQARLEAGEARRFAFVEGEVELLDEHRAFRK